MIPLSAYPPIPELSRRENEILSLIAEGYTNSEIARSLGLAASTVKNYVTSIYRKLYVRDRTNAAIYVWRIIYRQTVQMRRLPMSCSVTPKGCCAKG